ncbi:hypothetical protein ACHAW6_000813, partial [Cyclotella cf. meneghiniana]
MLYIDAIRAKGATVTTLTLTEGNDERAIEALDEPTVVEALGGDDLITGHAPPNSYWLGGAGNDALEYQGTGVAHLFGGEGNDTIHGNTAGGDDLDGGAGDDLVSSGQFNWFTAIGTGRIELPDGYISGSDTLNGREGRDALYGFDGDDKLYGGMGDDAGIITVAHSTIVGSTMTVQAGLFGGSGNDYIDGGEGNDFIDGGQDNDFIEGGDNDDRIYGGDGSDVIHGDNNFPTPFAGNDWIDGGAGDDYISGGAGNDTIFGGDGDDRLDGGAGADAFDGGLGFDIVTYSYPYSGVTADLANIVAGTGDAAGDTFTFVDGLAGTVYGDLFFGDQWGNRLAGGNGSDNLYGRAGNDVLYGDMDNDHLDGGAGADVLDGGTGFDFAYYSQATSGVRADLAGIKSGTGDAAGDTFIDVDGLAGSQYADDLYGDHWSNTL